MEFEDDVEYTVTVKQDHNDADYVSESWSLTGAEIKRVVLPVAEALRGNPCNAWNGGCWERSVRTYDNDGNYKGMVNKGPTDWYPDLDPKIIEEFGEMFIRYNSFGMAPHTIESITFIQGSPGTIY